MVGDEFTSARAQLEIIRDEEIAHKEFLEKLMADPTAIYSGAACEDETEVEEAEEELEDEKEEEPLTEDLDEELKVFTSTLSGFHPSEKSEGLWNEIKDADKVEDLEYALEALYPDGISDVALDDMLSNEPDWIRDMIGLDEPELEEEEPIDEFEDEEIEPLDGEESSDDDWTEEPFEESEEEDELEEPMDDDIDGLEQREVDEESSDEELDDLDDEEPIEISDEDLEEKPESKEEEKAEKEHPLDESFCKDCDDEQTAKLADGFVNKQFKQNEISEEEATPKKEIAETMSDTDEDEIVAIDDSSVEDMLGMPKSEKK